MPQVAYDVIDVIILVENWSAESNSCQCYISTFRSNINRQKGAVISAQIFYWSAEFYRASLTPSLSPYLTPHLSLSLSFFSLSLTHTHDLLKYLNGPKRPQFKIAKMQNLNPTSVDSISKEKMNIFGHPSLLVSRSSSNNSSSNSNNNSNSKQQQTLTLNSFLAHRCDLANFFSPGAFIFFEPAQAKKNSSSESFWRKSKCLVVQKFLLINHLNVEKFLLPCLVMII